MADQDPHSFGYFAWAARQRVDTDCVYAQRWDMLRRRIEGRAVVRGEGGVPWTPLTWLDLEVYLDAEVEREAVAAAEYVLARHG